MIRLVALALSLGLLAPGCSWFEPRREVPPRVEKTEPRNPANKRKRRSRSSSGKKDEQHPSHPHEHAHPHGPHDHHHHPHPHPHLAGPDGHHHPY